MSRERLSWKKNREARRQRTADPYQMNVERHNPPTEDYMTGDPSAWAEDPVSDLSRMDGTDRDPIGMPNVDDTTWNHQDADNWNSGGSYDNEGGKLAAEARDRLANMQRHFEKKALHCIRIARALFPTASDDLIQEQALDFMPLPDDAVIATALRLAEDAEEEQEDGEEEEKEKEGKKSSLSPDEMLRRMLAAEDGEEDEEEDESKEASDDEDEDDESKEATDDNDEDDEEDKESKKARLMTQARALIAEAAKIAEDDEEDDEEEEEEEEDSDEDVEAKKSSAKEAGMLDELMAEAGMMDDMDDMDMDDMDDMGDMDDVDMMMSEMEEDMGYEATAELGIDLAPGLDHLDAAALLEQSDDDLFRLMNRQQVDASPKTASEKGVQQLGRVKEAGSKGDDLSKLWKHAPDVSEAFK